MELLLPEGCSWFHNYIQVETDVTYHMAEYVPVHN